MNLSDTIGIVGGLAGLLALGIEAYSLWKRRSPNLTMFTPYYFSGEAPDNKRILFVLVRISNSSERIANLYLETATAEILYKGRWYPVIIPNFAKGISVDFDLPEAFKHHAGIGSFDFFNKFDEANVSIDYPYSRYMGFHSHQTNAIDAPERLRLTLRDCNLKKIVVESEILKNDPEHMIY